MSKKIPLYDLLEAIDRNNYGFYDSLSDEQKKDFSPWLAMRYASSSTGDFAPYHLMAVNQVANVDFSSISKHPKLQWLLLASCGTGSKMTHPWVAPPKTKANDKLRQLAKDLFPSYDDDSIDMVLQNNTSDDIIQIAKDMGYQDSELKAFK